MTKTGKLDTNTILHIYIGLKTFQWTPWSYQTKESASQWLPQNPLDGMDIIIHITTHLIRQERTCKEELKTVSCCKTCCSSYLWRFSLPRSCSFSAWAPLLCKILLQKEHNAILYRYISHYDYRFLILRCKGFWIQCWLMMIKIYFKALKPIPIVSLSSILPLNLPLFQNQGKFLPIQPVPCAK